MIIANKLRLQCKAEEERLDEMNRRRLDAIARGEEDPMKGQPLDNGASYFMASRDTVEGGKRGNIFAMNRKQVALALVQQTHEIATFDELSANEQREYEAHLRNLATDARGRDKRVVQVEAVPPRPVRK